MNDAHIPRNKLKTFAQFALGLCFFAVAFLFTCVNFGSRPNNRTIYYVDDESTYYSPPLMERDPRPFAYSMFTEDAIDEGFEPLDARINAQTNYDALVYANPKTMKWVVRGDIRDHIPVSTISSEELRELPDRKPDVEHRNANGFQDWCGPIAWASRKLGFAEPRFTAEGDWNW